MTPPAEKSEPGLSKGTVRVQDRRSDVLAATNWEEKEAAAQVGM